MKSGNEYDPYTGFCDMRPSLSNGKDELFIVCKFDSVSGENQLFKCE